MAGGKRCGKRVSNLGAAILVLAGLAQLQPVPPQTARAGERRQDTPMAPALAAAIRGGDTQTVAKLIEAGADAKAGDFPETNHSRAATRAAGYRTPLMWAAFNNDVPMVRLLLERGADPNQATAYGSPLSQACWSDGVEAARILIDRGAKVDA